VKQFRLCYVEEPWAYFTTQELSKQWGDDWDDRPYEHNAGAPYKWHDGRDGEPWEIVKVAWYADLITPCEGHVNSPYSVQDINQGAVPWLRTPSYSSRKVQVEIYAGTTLDEFIRVVESVGGEVYLKHEGIY
jgi:hypothetical protein